MKNTILLLFSLTAASVSYAAAKKAVACPSDMTSLYACLSTPKANDHQIAAEIVDSISICTKASDVLMVAEKDGESSSGKPTVTRRAGGIDYSITDDSDGTYRLSLPAGVAPSEDKEVKGRFYLSIANTDLQTISSTYTCKTK